MVDAMERLIKMKNRGIMTKDQPIEEYIKCLRKRYFRAFNEILPADLDELVKKLEEKNIL